MIVAGLAKLFGATSRSEAGPSYNITDRSFWGLFGMGSEASSGIKVTRDKALSDAAFWRGINLISLDIAKAPIDILRRRGDNKERDSDHPAYNLLRYEPNEYMTAIQFVRTLQAHADVCGYGVAYIERDRERRPTALLPLNPDKVMPERKNGTLVYRYWLDDGQEIRIPAMDALFIPGLSWDGVVPLSTLTYARDVLGLSLAAREYAARFFSNDATPGMALKHPGRLNRDVYDRLKESWGTGQGVSKAHRAKILEEGMDIIQFTKNAKESQLDESRLHQIREVASVLGIPSHKLGDPNRTSYNSLEQDELNYQNQTLDGRWRVWEQECRFKLLSEKERAKDSHVIEFNRNALVRADIGARYAAYKVGLDGGFLSIDEVRARENLNPLPDGLGRTHLVPLNMTPLKSYAAMLKRLDETGDGEADVEFKRKVLLAMLADPTVGDVVYNLTAVEKLIEGVGLAREADMKAPALPIVAAAGPLVTGEVIKDGDGDIVGGDIEQPEPATGDGLEPQADPGNNDVGNVGSSAAAGEGGTAPADPPNSDAAEAARAVLSDAYARLSRRVAEQARREAKKGGKRYMRWASEIFAAETREIAIAALKPGCLVMSKLTGIEWVAAEHADRWLEDIEESLLRAADCQEKELLGSVENAAKRLEKGEKEAKNE